MCENVCVLAVRACTREAGFDSTPAHRDLHSSRHSCTHPCAVHISPHSHRSAPVTTIQPPSLPTRVLNAWLDLIYSFAVLVGSKQAVLSLLLLFFPFFFFLAVCAPSLAALIPSAFVEVIIFLVVKGESEEEKVIKRERGA